MAARRTVSDWLSISGCVLCDEVRNANPLSERLGLYARNSDKIILESEHLVLVRDISPLVPGHLLLLTKDHYCSFAKVPCSMLNEFQDVRDRSIAYLADIYGAPLLFEHGSSKTAPSVGTCIDHAHIHLLPVSAPVEEWLEEVGDVTPGSTAGHQHDVSENYLWYRKQDGSEYFVQSFHQPIPSQFIRRVLADHLNIAEWNWKTRLLRIPVRRREGEL